jgi:hypothetical protein
MADDPRKDLPPAGSANFSQRVLETLRVYLGKTGNPLDRGATLRDLVDAGLADPRAASQSGAVIPGAAIPPAGSYEPVYVPDLTPPPTPTGLTVTASISHVFVEHDDPTYTAGHGHLRTHLYGAIRATGAPAPVFADADELAQFSGAVYALPANPATTWHLWIKWESVDGVLSAAPAGGTNGAAATTGQDVSLLLNALTGQITESQLYADLGTRIGLIDAPSSTAGSVAARVLAEANQRIAAVAQEASDRAAAITAEANARGTAITNERTMRQTADTGLAQQISLLTAGVAGGFDPAVMWHFDAGLEGWQAFGATLAAAGGVITLTSAGSDPILDSPDGLAINGAAYKVVKARVKRLAGSGWDGNLYWRNVNHGHSGSYVKQIPPPSPFGVGDVAVLEWDMSTAVGAPDWADTPIANFRLDIGTTAADVFEIDWIGVGRNAPGASTAAVEAMRLAYMEADQAEAAERLALAATVTNNNNTQTASVVAANQARADGDTANANAITALDARVGGSNNWIENPDGAGGDLTGWYISFNASGHTDVRVFPSADPYRPAGGSAVAAYANGSPLGSGVSFDTTCSDGLVVQPGKRYQFSVVLNSHRCLCDVFIVWQLGDGTYISEIHGDTQTTPTFSSSGDLSTWTPRHVFGTAPANARTVRIGIRALWYGTTVDQYVFMTHAFFSEAGANQTVPSPYAPGPTKWSRIVSMLAADQNSASAITTLQSRLNSGGDVANSIATAQSTANTAVSNGSANASAITTLQTTVGGNTTSIQQQATSINGINAQVFTKIDNNGYVTGYALGSSTGPTGTPTSTFAVRSDQFYIASPSGPGISPTVPFITRTTSTTINGVSVPAGNYLTDAFIQNGTITNAKIGNAAIDDAKIASLSAAKVTFGEMSGDRISANSLHGDKITANSVSAGKMNVTSLSAITANMGDVTAGTFRTSGTKWWYDGTAGVAISNNGGSPFVEFAGGSSTLRFSSWGDCSINFPNFLVQNDGVLRIGPAGSPKLTVDGSGNATFSGSLSAASGTFAGSLSGATGTFSGSLSAASGTFSGSLTASAVNAVDTINLAGNAITLPLWAAGSDPTVWLPVGATGVNQPVIVIAFFAQGGYSGIIPTRTVSITANGGTIASANGGLVAVGVVNDSFIYDFAALTLVAIHTPGWQASWPYQAIGGAANIVVLHAKR